MSRKRQERGPGGVWMLEEATGLLRALPARSWIVWLAGTLPFTWVLIDFLLEMARSAFGPERLVGRSLLLALLYVAKHVAQGWFSRDCLQVLRGDRVTAPGGEALARLALVQAAAQPFRFAALALAGFALAPFPWTVAFLRQIGLAALERERGFVREAWRLARTDTRAHSVALLVLFLCGLLLFVNLLVLWFITPMLLKAFFGVQTEAGRLAGRLLNATTFLATGVLTFAALEPVAGALAAVRAFCSQAQSGGEDLRGALRRLAAGVLVFTVLLGGVAGPAAGQERPLEGAALDRQIDDVLRDPEFAWKMPRDAKQTGGFTGWIRGFFEAVARWAEWVLDLYKKLFPSTEGGAEGGGGRWSVDPQVLRWTMIAAAVLAGGCLLIILRLRRHAPRVSEAVAEPAATPVDLADENLSAAQLVEDEWLRMADQYAATGDYRLAMRALHLAGLRYLGEKGVVTLQPAKTGLEYGREVARRLRDTPAAVENYGVGLRQYEGVWYGFGAAAAESYQALQESWQEVRRYA